jgi:hypothetical protein
VLRGGPWAINAFDARCAYRFFNDPGNAYGDLGFRCVRGLEFLFFRNFNSCWSSERATRVKHAGI